MKKRAQVPDAHTYTIIFRGCAEHRDSTQALAKVMSIYQGMLAEKSPVKPNVIHMNALLKMCARAQDLDAMFAIANSLPDKGPRAPNNLTYTTIINAIRIHATIEPPDGQSPMQKRIESRDAIVRSRHIWADVVTRWRKGDIWIDEELVSTMGRTLLLGQSDDLDDIFSLIEQSMNIPRQFPRMRPPRAGAESGTREPEEREMEPYDTPKTKLDVHAPNEVDQDNTNSQVENFTAIIPITSPNDSSAYAKPGKNSLSLVLKALLLLHLQQPGPKQPVVNYWKIFTKDLGVVPDGENYASYLRLLRLFRASTETVELLQQIPRQYMAHKIFRIAMSACARDKLNRNAFRNAGKILDIMQTQLQVPDIPTLLTYLDVALTSPAYGNNVASTQDAHHSDYAQGRQILRALERLGPSFVNLRALLAYGDPTSLEKERERQSSEFQNDVLDLSQRMVRAIDVLMNRALVPREMYQNLTRQRSKLAAFVTRYKHIKPIRSYSNVQRGLSSDKVHGSSSRQAYATQQGETDQILG